jgi:cyclopropane-fatty-acyl-phospholipid synthase
LALGEAYMDGWWDADQLDELIYRLLRADIRKSLKSSPGLIWHYFKSVITNRQSRARAFEVGQKHYDIGNDLYSTMLDQRLTYTCAYWSDKNQPGDLDAAQEAKLDLVCRKLGLKAGDRVLDIGCGWGSFLKFAAEKYGVHGVGVTVSKEQKELADRLCVGLPVEIRLQDYRDLNEKFDHIVSLGMFEHVGYKNYRQYMQIAARCLNDDGLFLLHTIGGNFSTTATEPWMEKYIFPNGMLPSVGQIGTAIEKLFIMEDWHNFGPDYDRTLMAWFKNFDQAWPQLKDNYNYNYNERFYRMWKYYLLSCAGGFRARNTQLWQIVLSKTGVPDGYKSVR